MIPGYVMQEEPLKGKFLPATVRERTAEERRPGQPGCQRRHRSRPIGSENGCCKSTLVRMIIKHFFRNHHDSHETGVDPT